MLPKPQRRRVVERILEGKPLMTIAIGAMCDGGLIVAADTRVFCSDGSTATAKKVHTSQTNTGCYVIACSTTDANAANTLIPDLQNSLAKHDPQSLDQVEKVTRESMASWSAQYPSGSPPEVQLIMGVFINRVQHPAGRTSGGLGLYFCEPPNTMVASISRQGYTAVGSGSTVTDPIFRAYSL
jgi:20S proteasome alpha/beta subunit